MTSTALVGVLTGAGDAAFCAGGDLKAGYEGDALVQRTPSELAAHARGERPGVLGPSRWTDIYKPTIAAVNGVAYAGGLEWACWTDLCIADERASFGVTCRRWNIGLADGGTQRLTADRRLPPRDGADHHRARDRRARGARDRSRQRGRTGRHVAFARRRTGSHDRGATAAGAMRTDIEAARRGFGRPLDEGLRIEAECFNRSIFDGATIEGLRQFNERDHPDRRAGDAPITPGIVRRQT